MWWSFKNCLNFLNNIGEANFRMYNAKKTIDLSKYTVAVPEEMFDFLLVLQQAADSGKYDDNNWLRPDGKTMNPRDNYASITRHLAENYCGHKKDKHSGLHPLLHVACRAMMQYVRESRNIVYKAEDDISLKTDYVNTVRENYRRLYINAK